VRHPEPLVDSNLVGDLNVQVEPRTQPLKRSAPALPCRVVQRPEPRSSHGVFATQGLKFADAAQPSAECHSIIVSEPRWPRDVRTNLPQQELGPAIGARGADDIPLPVLNVRNLGATAIESSDGPIR
jgi:hypothetical protein